MSPLPDSDYSHAMTLKNGGNRPPSPTMSCVVKVADFSSQSYWEHRFASESSFEWLQPSSSILPAIKAELQAQQGAAVLHLGSGSSDLSNHLRRLTSSRHDHSEITSLILNVDFSPAAIELGRRHEREEFGNDRMGDMQWAVVDVLNWTSFKRVCMEHCGRAFDMIVEKSCTDALACGPEVQLRPASNGMGASRICLQTGTHLLPPAAALATYLAAVTRPGAAWIALSYSAGRFDFLRDDGDPAAQMWSIEQVQKIVLNHDETGVAGATVHRPEMAHFLYIIRRSLSGE